jgi:hypothetical protein
LRNRLFEQFLDGQLDAAALIHVQHLDLDLVTLGEMIRDILDALVGDLRDVQQAVLARQDVDEGTEVHDALDRCPFVDRADFASAVISSIMPRPCRAPLLVLTEDAVTVPSSFDVDGGAGLSVMERIMRRPCR